MLFRILITLSIVLAGFGTNSQAKEDALKIGSVAPKLDIEHWVSNGNGRFSPVTSFQSGKVYVVEFWATWCGPCIATMPHLSELQSQYADKGVQIISISDENLPTVESFLKRNVPGTDDSTYGKLTGVYCLTTDPDGSSHDEYMRAAGQTGIPAAFIVGKQGHIEWIGHPAEIDKPLEEVVTGKWDRVAYSKKQEETKKALQIFQKVMREVGMKMQAGETDEAIKLVESAIADNKGTDIAKELTVARLEILLSTGDKRAAGALTEFAKENNQPEVLVQLAGGIAQMKAAGEEIDDSVMQAVQSMAEQAVKARPDDGRILFTLARVYHQNGNLDKAIETQKKAMENAGEFRERIAPFLDVLMEEKAGK